MKSRSLSQRPLIAASFAKAEACCNPSATNAEASMKEKKHENRAHYSGA
jgi:hypothetical protein